MNVEKSYEKIIEEKKLKHLDYIDYSEPDSYGVVFLNDNLILNCTKADTKNNTIDIYLFGITGYISESWKKEVECTSRILFDNNQDLITVTVEGDIKILELDKYGNYIPEP